MTDWQNLIQFFTDNTLLQIYGSKVLAELEKREGSIRDCAQLKVGSQYVS